MPGVPGLPYCELEVKAERGHSEGPQASGGGHQVHNSGAIQPQCAEDLGRGTHTAILGLSLRLTLPLTGCADCQLTLHLFSPSAMRRG